MLFYFSMNHNLQVSSLVFILFSGELSAHCVGPHKVAYCELYDHGDGTFTLNVKPQEAGRHTLTVKYGGNYILNLSYLLVIFL
jgi:filamin